MIATGYTTTKKLRIAVGLLVIVAAMAVAAWAWKSSSSTPPSHHPPSQQQSRGPTKTPFAPSSIWNQPLAAGAPLATNSSSLVAQLQHQVTSFGAWINTSSYSTPIYTVPGSQKRVPVTLHTDNTSLSARDLTKAFRAGVPIPSDARPAPGTDRDLVIWQPSTDKMWELWVAQRTSSGWRADWGGEMLHVSHNPGYFTYPTDWGIAATSLPLLGGMMRISDLRAGHIDHALAISIPEARKYIYASPAQRTDGGTDSPNAIPEGTRFRLDPKLDIAKLGLPPLTRMIAEAAQRYGLIVRDQSGSVALYAQQNTNPSGNPYSGANGLFDGQSPKALLQSFPWSHLQVIKARLHG
jgi:hypothetical protein